jgi:hypothetical protein
MIKITFFEVSHYEVDFESWASFETRMISVLKRTNEDIVEILKPRFEMLRIMKKSFHNILRLRKNEEFKIFITCFYEELRVIEVEKI